MSVCLLQLQGAGHLLAEIVQHAPDGAFRPLDPFGDLGDLVAFDAQAHDLALQLRQALKDLVDGQLQKRKGSPIRRTAVMVQRLEPRAANGEADISLGGAVMVAGSANLVLGDDGEELPQRLTSRHVIVALVEATEEGRKTDWTMSSASRRRARSAEQQARARSRRRGA
jgi:hypothetical protein